MRSKYILSVFAAIAGLGFLVWIGTLLLARSAIPTGSGLNKTLSLVTEPDAGIEPVLALIRNARVSVDLVMYELVDARVEEALVADERRGVAVRVLLSAGYKGASSAANQGAYDLLSANGVPVRWTQNYFSLTHEKSLVVDGKRAFIMTFNLVSKYYVTGRDFGILDADARDVAAMEVTFDADWQGRRITAPAGDDLVWSPGSERALVEMIERAKHSLAIYNEEIADPAVNKALIDAALRGVTIDVIMTYSSEWKRPFEALTTAGVRVHTYEEDASLYIHAKMIIADGDLTFIGSENFSPTSLGENRELGIIITDRAIVTALMGTFREDMTGAVLFPG